MAVFNRHSQFNRVCWARSGSNVNKKGFPFFSLVYPSSSFTLHIFIWWYISYDWYHKLNYFRIQIYFERFSRISITSFDLNQNENVYTNLSKAIHLHSGIRNIIFPSYTSISFHFISLYHSALQYSSQSNFRTHKPKHSAFGIFGMRWKGERVFEIFLWKIFDLLFHHIFAQL